MNYFRRLKAWLSLWLIVSVLGHFGLSHPETPAWVLCIGADGHVAVEPADHNHRPLPDTDKLLLPSGSASAQALKVGEGPCLDFPVASSDPIAHPPLTGPQRPSLDKGLAVTAVPLIIGFSLYPKVMAKPVFPPDPFIADSRLIALRTVVLLN